MGPVARSPVADAASGSELFGLHSTQGRPNKEYVDLRVSGWEAGGGMPWKECHVFRKQ
jgi:hypothetical protein